MLIFIRTNELTQYKKCITAFAIRFWTELVAFSKYIACHETGPHYGTRLLVFTGLLVVMRMRATHNVPGYMQEEKRRRIFFKKFRRMFGISYLFLSWN